MNDDRSEELALRIEAAERYLHEATRMFSRAVSAGYLTAEAATNTLLAAASLIASAHFAESAGAAFLEQRVASLAENMREKQQPLN